MRKHIRLGTAVAAAALIAACGGGGGGDAPASAKFSGTAATGAPLVGTVTVKDSKGATKTVTIGTNGRYDVDVTGMTGPFVFRAEGTVGGRTSVIHSAATSADANGTINITPLTDLVVANIAGQLASNYFASGSFASLTADQLKAEADGLKAKLLPMLTAMGVENSIDLLRTSFTPLTSALDAALDVLRVSVDSTTNKATITNLVNQQQIIDDLAVKAAAEASATPMPGTGMGTAKDDIAAIRKVLTDFTALFANGSPAAGVVQTFLTDGTLARDGNYTFRFDDETATGFANELIADSSLVGGAFTDVVIRRFNYDTTTADNTAPRAWVDFTHKDKNGVIFSRQENFQLVKGTDNKWRLRGNGRALAVYGVSQMVKNVDTGCLISGLEFGIEDINTGNSGTAAYAMVTGPGLPEGGLKYQRPALNGYWTLANAGNQNGGRYYRLTSTCTGVATAGATEAAITAIPANAVYTITGYTAEGTVAKIGNSTFDITTTEKTQARPLTLAELANATFAEVTTTPDFASYSGGTAIAVSASKVNPAVAAEIYVGLTTASGTTSQRADVSPATTGTASTSITIPTQANITRREVRVGTTDTSFRELITVRTLQ